MTSESEALRKYVARLGSGTPEAEHETYIPGRELARRVVDSVRTLGEQTAFIGNVTRLYRRCGSALSG